MFSRYFSKVSRPSQSLMNSHSLDVSKRYVKTGLEYFEPPYLESMKPKLPVYEAITVQIKGYDFPVLEQHQRFIHSVAEFMNLKVDLCWAQPARHYNIRRVKPNKKQIDSVFKLLMYERNLKLLNVPAVKLPLLTEFIQAAMPEGTQLKIFPFDEEHEKQRYVPDHDLIAKMKELDELGGPPTEDELSRQ